MDVEKANGSYDKDSDKRKCATENDLFGQDLRKQYISILESFEPVFVTDESAIQHELNWLRQF